MIDKPKDLKKVGVCARCGETVYLSDSDPTGPYSNVGDYDFVCYPCEFTLIDAGEWQNFVSMELSKQ